LVDVTTPLAPARAFTPRDTALLLSLGAMWGLSFLFIELALRGLTPIWIVSGRTVTGALFLLAVLRVRRQPLPRDRWLWLHLAVLGIVSNAVPWTAVAWAQQAIPSGLAALIMALVPSSTLVVSVLVGMERFNRLRVLGLAMALAGVGLTVAGDLGDPGRVLAIITVVLATLFYAAGAVYAKRFVSGVASPLTVATGQVLSAGVVSTAVAAVFEPAPALGDLSATVVGATVALGVLGTGGAFLLFYMLVERVGATNTTLVTYLIPLVAVVAGAVVLGERLTPAALAGGALIGIGIWLAQRGSRPGPVERLEELSH
jgi:drug/metabolite transporter (DMT)-like permease